MTCCRLFACAALLALALPSPASAVHLDPHGLGQVLIFPYYTVNAGRVTVFSINNTTNRPKAIKLRMREGVKGRVVLDANLYLGVIDTYTAALIPSQDGTGARLISIDQSCTVPAFAPTIDGNYREIALRYEGPADGPAGLERTREGWIELIEMGELQDEGSSPADSFFFAVQPDGGRPPGCERVVQAWESGGVWRADPTRAMVGDSTGVHPPRGGLAGSALIVDVAVGTAFSYSPEAIDGFYRLPQTQLHTPPGSVLPDLASAQTRPGFADARVFVDGRALDLSFVAGRPDAVSAVLMADALANEHNFQAGLGAASEWIVTFPTRHLHEAQVSAARRRPFATGSAGCERVGLAYFDRETGPEAPFPIVDFPTPPEGTHQDGLCQHAQVLAWQARHDPSGPTPLLGAQLLGDFRDDQPLLMTADGRPVDAGHVELLARGQFLLDGVENAGSAPRTQLFGLPMLGVWASNYVNGNARPGILANYSNGSRLRALRSARAVRVSGEGTPDETITPLSHAGATP